MLTDTIPGYPTSPYEFNGVYTDDLNLLELHDKMLKHLDWEIQKKLPILRQLVEQELNQQPESIVQLKSKKERISYLQEEIAKLESKQNYNSYMEQVKDILIQYVNLPRKKVFGISIVTQPDEYMEQRLYLINRYLELISKYVKVNIFRRPERSSICEICGFDYGSYDITDSCPNCHVQINIINRNTNAKIKTKPAKNNYEDRNNFYRTLIRYQGKQIVKLPDDIFTRLDNYFSSYHLPTANEIKKRPLDERGRREGTTLNLMLTALKNIGLSEHYENARLICHLYWDWKLPNVSNLEKNIMDDYEQFQSRYRSYKKNRKSSLNTQLLLYHLLKKNGHMCYRDDFKIVSTEEICRNQENIIKNIFTDLGWEFSY